MASYRLTGAIGRSLAFLSSRQKTNAIRMVVPSMRVGSTPLRQATGKAYSEVPHYLQEKMKIFQAANALPVHVKGGPMDKILYGITSLVCFLGLVDCCRVYYRLSYPAIKTD